MKMITKTIIKTLPKYELKIVPCDQWFYDETINELKDYYIKSIIKNKNYSYLNTKESFETDFDDFETDFKKWCDYINDEYKGEFIPFVLNAYIHSGTAFKISDEPVRGWDSGVLGFIAVRKELDKNEIAEQLTNLYEGFYNEYRIYDNEIDEAIDSIFCTDCDEELIQKLKDEYKII